MNTSDPRLARNEATVRAFLNGWNNRDADACMVHATEDMSYLNQPLETIKGKENVRKMIASILAPANRVAFELPRVMQTEYRIDDFQEAYFVINSLDDLLDLAKIDFAPLYAQVTDLPDIAAGQLLAQDRLFNRGTGSYHAKSK